MKCPQCHSDIPDMQRLGGDCRTQLQVNEEIPVLTLTIELRKKELTTGSAFVGGYHFIVELGKWGIGKAYKTFNTKINEMVAFKLIKLIIA